MVADNLKNAALYNGMGERIKKALNYLQGTDFSKMEPGRYEIDGSDIYALVQKYDTKPAAEGKWEAHRKYADIQYVVEGVEQMGYAFIESLEVSQEYDPEKDALLLRGSGSMVICNRGTFAIFGPEDAHMPCIAVDKPTPVKKVVVKVRI